MKKLGYILRGALLCALIVFVAVSCWNAADPLKKIELGEPVNIEVNTLGDFYLEIIGEPSDTGARAKMINNTDRTYGSDILFSVHAEKDGVWYAIEYDMPENAAFPADAYGYRKNSETEVSCGWGALYGRLPKGHYRIVFAVYEELYVGEPHYIAAEFYLE